MEDIEKQLKEQEEKITKDYLNARYGLWSALINVNGILIGASAIAFFVNPNASKLWAVILLFSSGISILLILINFFVVERLFICWGQLNSKTLMMRIWLKKERKRQALYIGY